MKYTFNMYVENQNIDLESLPITHSFQFKNNLNILVYYFKHASSALYCLDRTEFI